MQQVRFAPQSVSARRADAAPDGPVRVEVAMPRALYDRLTCHDDAPRCRYDVATGRAEFVAEPGPAHEGRAGGASRLFFLIEAALAAAGSPSRFFVGRATRLLSDDGAFEPDESLFIDPPDVRALTERDAHLDVRRGDPAPDLVVEIDRSVDSRRKLAPYFRMGVREAWTWSRADGARIWAADPAAALGFRAAESSMVLPGVARGELDDLFALRDPPDSSRRARRLADQVARALLARD